MFMFFENMRMFLGKHEDVFSVVFGYVVFSVFLLFFRLLGCCVCVSVVCFAYVLFLCCCRVIFLIVCMCVFFSCLCVVFVCFCEIFCKKVVSGFGL